MLHLKHLQRVRLHVGQLVIKGNIMGINKADILAFIALLSNFAVAFIFWWIL